LSQDEARALSSIGLGAIVHEPDPYTPASHLAVDCWLYLGGWHPERLPLYLAGQRIGDLAGLVQGLITIRDTIEAHKSQRATS
jgi:hypothetical protein